MFAFANKDGGMGACKMIEEKKKNQKKKQFELDTAGEKKNILS